MFLCAIQQVLDFCYSNPRKNSYQFPEVIFTMFPSTKTPTTVIFGNKLSLCIWCPTSTPHFEILAIPPSQTQLQVLLRKFFLMHIRLTHVQ